MTADAADLLEAVRAKSRVELPLPGGGRTRQRFEAFAELGAADLCLAKLVEPHHDATAILAEAGSERPGRRSLWAVWAAEPPHARLRATKGDTGWRLHGAKAFCSGAAMVTHALVTADTEGGARLFAIDVAAGRRTGAIEQRPEDWVGAGMRRAGTRTLDLRDVEAQEVGEPGWYAERPGFWHGAVGVSACWLGGARAVAARLVRSARGRELDPHAAAHLGAVIAVLDAASAQLQQVSEQIDADPLDNRRSARRDAQSVRATIVDAAEITMQRTARALGPAPLAFDAEHAQRVGDLEVFIRQHHGERDLADLGRLVVELDEGSP